MTLSSIPPRTWVAITPSAQTLIHNPKARLSIYYTTHKTSLEDIAKNAIAFEDLREAVASPFSGPAVEVDDKGTLLYRTVRNDDQEDRHTSSSFQVSEEALEEAY